MTARRQQPQTDVPGTTYLLHLVPPFKHARHYTGFAEGGADELARRLAEHGGPHGSPLLAAQRAAGGTWELVRTWPGTTRAFERHLKDTRHVPHYCPDCQPQRRAARQASPAGTKKGTTMTAQPELDHDPAAMQAFDDATRLIATQYAAGIDLDQIKAHHDDVSTQLLADAQTGPGRAYAREYATTAATLIADLRADASRQDAAHNLPDGTPHPDPVLAAKGWQVHTTPHGGLYVSGRLAAELDRQADREAG